MNTKIISILTIFLMISCIGCLENKNSKTPAEEEINNMTNDEIYNISREITNIKIVGRYQSYGYSDNYANINHLYKFDIKSGNVEVIIISDEKEQRYLKSGNYVYTLTNQNDYNVVGYDLDTQNRCSGYLFLYRSTYDHILYKVSSVEEVNDRTDARYHDACRNGCTITFET